jgi:hypothetical protein
LKVKEITMIDNNKSIQLLEKAKELGIPLRLMTEEEIAEKSKSTQNPFFKKKLHIALKVATEMSVHKLADEHPDWHAKDVLAEIIKGYNPEIPSVLLLEMAQLILDKWEKIQAKNKAMQLA